MRNRGREKQLSGGGFYQRWNEGLVSECRGSVPQQGLPTSSSLPTSLLLFQCFIKITAAYGSTKDISVYSVLGLPASQIFIVGRPTKKYQTQCQVCEGQGKGLGQLPFIQLPAHPFFYLFIHL